MLTRPSGAVAPIASDIEATDGTTMQEFYDQYLGGGGGGAPVIDFDINNASSLWTGTQDSVDLTGLAGYNASLPIFVTYELKFDDGSTLGNFTTTVFSSTSQVVHTTGGSVNEYARISAGFGEISIVGGTDRLGKSADFILKEIKQ